MFDEYLKTFICVAECGSFSKAAELLYLSPNAVKKRVACIEENTGIHLFERTLKGEKLTPAGKSFYGDAKNLVQNYNNAAERAKKIQESDDDVVKIGIMDTFADEFMIAKWFQPSEKSFHAKTSIVLYGSSREGLNAMLKGLNNEIDFAVDICDSRLAAKFGVKSVKISEAKICCAVPFGHRLYEKEELSPADLCGEKTAVLKSGRSDLWDETIAKIKNDYFGIDFFEIEKYSIKTLNRCENENRVVIMTENSKKVYPFFKTIPLNKTYTIPFGLYCPENPSEKTSSFIEMIKSFSPKD